MPVLLKKMLLLNFWCTDFTIKVRWIDFFFFFPERRSLFLIMVNVIWSMLNIFLFTNNLSCSCKCRTKIYCKIKYFYWNVRFLKYLDTCSSVTEMLLCSVLSLLSLVLYLRGDLICCIITIALTASVGQFQITQKNPNPNTLKSGVLGVIIWRCSICFKMDWSGVQNCFSKQNRDM